MSWLVERRELLDRFRKGERRALEEVYRHYAPIVAQFLTRGFTFASDGRTFRFAGTHQPFDLDNGLQETFMRAFKESARLGYDGLRPYTNYLFTIARNYVMDEFRKKEVALASFVEVEGEPLAEAEASDMPAETRVLQAELQRLYSTFVERLEERDRTFFGARFESQQSQIDAGKAVGLSHMQARTLEKKLRQQFLAYMHTNGYLETYGAQSERRA